MSEIKDKINKLKKKEQELNLKAQAIEELQPLYRTLKSKLKEQTKNNQLLVLKEIANNLEERIKESDSNSIIEAIELQTNKLEDKNSLEILKQLKGMVKGIQKLEEKTYFDVDEFNYVFNEGVHEILSIISRPEDIPLNTKYRRSNIKGQRKITSVVEEYEDHTIQYDWSYDKNGDLVNIETTRNEIT